MNSFCNSIKFDSKCARLSLCANDCRECLYFEDCAEFEGLDLFSVDCDDFTDYDRYENDEYLAYVTSLS